MPQLQLATPRQGSFLPLEHRETLQSCMKPTPVHKSSASQVRFSLPPQVSEARVEHFAGVAMDARVKSYTRNHERREFSQATEASGPKIVYPRSDSGEIAAQVIDVEDKVKDPVPNHVWDFRKPATSRRGQGGHSRSHSIAGASNVIAMSEVKPRSHLRSRSLQSATFEAINSYVSPSAAPLPPLSRLGQGSNDSSVSILQLSANPHNQSKQLYIRPESPLNKSKVPIPLEIHVPPLFSPENMHKRASALLDDGEACSVYHEESSSPATSEDADRSETSAASSDGCIPLAVNHISIDLNKENLNDVLRIEEESSINSKKHVRNLSGRSPFRGKPRRAASPHMEVLQEARVAVPQTNCESPCSEARLRGLRRNNLKPVGPLEILSTPTKLITIPDFENEPAPKGRNVLSGFFSLDEEHTPQDASPNIPRDRLDESFKFPKSKFEHSNEPGGAAKGVQLHPSSPRVQAASDFLRVPEPHWEASIDTRRTRLQRENILGHHHRRSRSIHTADDMFNPGYPGTPPKKNPSADSPYLEHGNRSRLSLSNFRIPERSPLRPKSMLVDTAPKIEPLFERAQDDLLVVTNRIVPDIQVSPIVDMLSTPEKEEQGVSVHATSGICVHSQHELIVETNKLKRLQQVDDLSEVIEQGVSGTPSKPFVKITSAKDNFVSSALSSSAETSFLEDGDTSSASNIDKTSKIIELGKPSHPIEAKRSAVKKLPALNSATETLHPPNLLSRVRNVSSDPHVNHVIKQKVNNRLDPKRSLSNGLSNSSYDSDFSTPSCQPSVVTVMSGTVSRIDSIGGTVKNIQLLNRSEDQLLPHTLVPFNASKIMDPLSDKEEEDVAVKSSSNTNSIIRTPEKSIITEFSCSTDSTVGPRTCKQNIAESGEIEAIKAGTHFNSSKKSDDKTPKLINDTANLRNTNTHHSTAKDVTLQGNRNKKKGWSPKRFAKLRSKSFSWLEKRFYRFKKPL